MEDLLREHEANEHTPNYINYSLLEMQDPDSLDIVKEGEKLLEALDKHKNVSGDSVQNQIN